MADAADAEGDATAGAFAAVAAAMGQQQPAGAVVEAMAPAGVQLVRWAVTRGARVSDKVAFHEPGPGQLQGSEGDRCCRARAAISEGEVLVQLPRSLAFETPPAEPLGVSPELVRLLQPVAEEGGPGCPSGKSLVVALLVHHERMKGDCSEFVAYLNSLPTDFPTMPLIDKCPPWESPGPAVDTGGGQAVGCDSGLYSGTGVEMMALEGGALAGPRGVARMHSVIEQLDPLGLHFHHAQRGNFAALRWAAAAVQSRAHSSSERSTALVPLADAFNHSPTSPNVELRVTDTSFIVEALCDVEEGEELLLSYGPFSNAELLFNAGFSCPLNPNDCMLASQSELVEAARAQWQAAGQAPPTDLGERCAQLWEKCCGSGGARLRASAPLLGGAAPVGVVTLLSGLLLGAAEWRQHAGVDFASLRDSWSVDSPAAEDMRRKVCGGLLALAEGALRSRYAEERRGSDVAALADAEQAEVTAVERLRAAEAATDVTFETVCERSASRAEAVACRRRANILRVRAGERRVAAQVASAARARLSAVVSSTAGPCRKRARVEREAEG